MNLRTSQNSTTSSPAMVFLASVIYLRWFLCHLLIIWTLWRSANVNICLAFIVLGNHNVCRSFHTIDWINSVFFFSSLVLVDCLLFTSFSLGEREDRILKMIESHGHVMLICRERIKNVIVETSSVMSCVCLQVNYHEIKISKLRHPYPIV